MRIYIASIQMEANSFNPVNATIQTFKQGAWYEGEEMGALRGTALQISGAYKCFDAEPDIEIVPGLYAVNASSAGPAKDKDFKIIVDRILEYLRNASKVDGVLLMLHGAMASDKEFDCEGYLLEKVRKIVGDEIPICASLDFHAMLTKKMMDNLDGIAGYLTYPHLDLDMTAYRAAKCLVGLVRSGIKPKDIIKIYKTIPIIISCENSNSFDSPMVFALDKLKELLASDGVLSAGMFMTQPWLDAPDLGFQVAVFFKDEEKRIEFERRAKEIINYVWNNRGKFYTDMPGIPEAIEIAKGMPKPMCFVDFGDVPGAGSSGDSVAVLKAFLEAKLECKSCVIVVDERSVKKAVELGEGGKGKFRIGGFGKSGDFNERIEVEAEVLKLNSEPFIHLGPAMRGTVNKPGMRVLLRSKNVYIILCEKVTIPADQNMLITMGLDPKEMGLISMKATHAFMSTYKDVIKSWLYVDTPGYSTRNHKTLPYKYCRRPIYPLDDFES